MGCVYHRIERHCTTCRKRLTRTEDRMACINAGHTIQERQSSIWRIKYVRAGKQYDETSHSKNITVAKRLLKLREGDIEHGIPITPQVGRVTFDEAADDMETEYRTNRRKTVENLERRIRLHLAPVFGGCRLINITSAEVTKYIEKRQLAGAANGQINLELAALKRMFSLAMRAGKILQKPYIPMLRESAPRAGFFEPEQIGSVLAHLPAHVRPLIQFALITGWRINSEVKPLQWRQVDFAAGEVRLDPGTTKNGEGRVFPFTAELRTLLNTLWAEHETLKQAGKIVPYVFTHDAEPIGSFRKTWLSACRAAGCPGRIPHDLRRTAVRNLVRASIPERVAMQMTGHKTRSVFERYNIVSDSDLRDAARRLDALR